eukprot:COSAG06_NODE_66350_length_254_cov_1.103226_1_plen_29_part_01
MRNRASDLLEVLGEQVVYRVLRDEQAREQ